MQSSLDKVVGYKFILFLGFLFIIGAGILIENHHTINVINWSINFAVYFIILSLILSLQSKTRSQLLEGGIVAMFIVLSAINLPLISFHTIALTAILFFITFLATNSFEERVLVLFTIPLFPVIFYCIQHYPLIVINALLFIIISNLNVFGKRFCFYNYNSILFTSIAAFLTYTSPYYFIAINILLLYNNRDKLTNYFQYLLAIISLSIILSISTYSGLNINFTFNIYIYQFLLSIVIGWYVSNIKEVLIGFLVLSIFSHYVMTNQTIDMLFALIIIVFSFTQAQKANYIKI